MLAHLLADRMGSDGEGEKGWSKGPGIPAGWKFHYPTLIEHPWCITNTLVKVLLVDLQRNKFLPLQVLNRAEEMEVRRCRVRTIRKENP
ncbi:hypothetical protein AVEN_85901-1 [Araneus ventricosus]|uniref:Uncharacterized protein n=1 Tax=Araneus ventricosus TaxID=182803 RepID=A0A4Y2LS98_ARAVE|nr:hypothetical protein AVEN_85901-1 [Araneus ventricosus]